eukprot:177830-Rhodomonas_salina.2
MLLAEENGHHKVVKRLEGAGGVSTKKKEVRPLTLPSLPLRPWQTFGPWVSVVLTQAEMVYRRLQARRVRPWITSTWRDS